MHPDGGDSLWWPVLESHFQEIHRMPMDRYKTYMGLVSRHVREHRGSLPHRQDDLSSPRYPNGDPRE